MDAINRIDITIPIAQPTPILAKNISADFFSSLEALEVNVFIEPINSL